MLARKLSESFIDTRLTVDCRDVDLKVSCFMLHSAGPSFM